MAFVAPEDRRFHRAQPSSVRRRRGPAPWVRITRFVLVMGVVVGSLAWAGWSAWRSGHFDVGDIKVHGNRYVPTAEILDTLAPIRQARLLQVDLDAVRDRVATSPWIADARVRRILPSTIDVEVVERRPLGMGRLGDRLVLVDASGLVIDDFGPRYADFDLPIIDGLDAGAIGAPGEPLRGMRAALASRLLSALVPHPELLARVSQVDVSDPANAVVTLEDDPARLFVGNRDFAARMSAYLELASALRSKVSEFDYVDLRYDTRVYARPAAGADVRGVKPATWPGRARRDRS